MGIRKFASMAILDAEVESSAPLALRRTAHRVTFEYEPRPGYLYVRSRMISSRCNDNFDEFSAEEIKGNGRTTGWKTFIGKPVFVNHNNDDHRRARGVIVDAALHEDRNPDGSPDTWVEGLMEIDAMRFPKLAKRILSGDIDRTSMGVDVDQSECSKCANRATSPLEYCAHIPAMKGRKIYQFTAAGQREAHLVRERCFGLRFFENSLLVEEPADPTAFFLDKPVSGPKMASKIAAKQFDASEFHAAHEGQKCSRWQHGDDPPAAVACRESGGSHLGACKTHKAEMTKESARHEAKDSRFEGVSLKQDDDGWYVATHRARSSSYQSPEAIPKHRVEFIRSTGARRVVGMHRCALCFSANTEAMLDMVECRDCTHVGRLGGGYSLSTTAAPQKSLEEMSHEERLNSFRVKDYENPGHHPVWDHLGAHHMNLVDHYDSATQEQHHDGVRWYPDAHILAHHIGQSTGHGTKKTSAMLAVMSPQMEWGINMHHALRGLHTGIAPGEGEGQNLTENTHRRKGQAILDGPDDEKFHHEVLKGPKTQTFNHLIGHGGMDPETGQKSRKVCVDVHAMSALCGRQLTGDDKKLGQKALSGHHFYAHAEREYQKATDHINDRDGTNLSPSELQAVVWGVRRARNKAENPNNKNMKALETTERNNRTTWRENYKDTGHDSWVNETAGHPDSMRNLHATRSRHPFAREAYGEVKAPADINTLRDENCPVCGESTSYDGNTCSVCGFVQPPKEFQDPDVDLAKRLDLRKDDADPNAMDVSDVQGVEDSINDPDRDGFDDVTGEPMDEPGDLECPVCGETFSSKPTSISTENPEAGSLGVDDPEQAMVDEQERGIESDGNAAAGDVCPNCGEGVLETPSEAEAEDGMTPEDAAEAGAPGSGDPTAEDHDEQEPEEEPHGDLHDDSEPEDENPFGEDEEVDDEHGEEHDDDPHDDPRGDEEVDDENFGEDEDDEQEQQKPAERSPWRR